MRKFITLIAALLTLATMAQQTRNNRLMVNKLDGTSDVFVVDSIHEITFDVIAQAQAPIALIDADDSSVRARVSMTEGCARYEVACYAADAQPDSIAAFVHDNALFNRKKAGSVEFMNLIPATDYVIASLAYDKYGLPCEVATMSFTTAQREEQAPAQVGDFLFSDGTWGSTLSSTKVPVAMVYSTTVTQADAARGYTHGYAVALGELDGAAWTTQASENESGSTVSTDGSDLADHDGLSHTLTLLTSAGTHPAAAAAQGYAATPYATSGWFLPAAGQWIDVLVNLGGLNATGFTRDEASGVATWEKEDAAACVEAFNARLATAGAGHYTPLNQSYYWTSSERSVATAFYLYVNANFNLSLQTYYKDSKFGIRPLIAF